MTPPRFYIIIPPLLPTIHFRSTSVPTPNPTHLSWTSWTPWTSRTHRRTDGRTATRSLPRRDLLDRQMPKVVSRVETSFPPSCAESSLPSSPESSFGGGCEVGRGPASGGGGGPGWTCGRERESLTTEARSSIRAGISPNADLKRRGR